MLHITKGAEFTLENRDLTAEELEKLVGGKSVPSVRGRPTGRYVSARSITNLPRRTGSLNLPTLPTIMGRLGTRR